MKISPDSTFLNKNTTFEEVTPDVVSSIFDDAAVFISDNLVSINSSNNRMLSLLDRSAALSQSTIENLSYITNDIANLFVLSGISKDSFDLIFNSAPTQEDGVVVDKNSGVISLDRDIISTYQVADIRIDSVTGEIGNTVQTKKRFFDKNNILSDTAHLEVESYAHQLDVMFIFDLGREVPINQIDFRLVNFGVRLPTVESIGVSTDGCEFENVRIHNTNTFNADLNKVDNDNGYFSLVFDGQIARYVAIRMVQYLPYDTGTDSGRRYAIGINSVRLAYSVFKQAGSIVIGPFKSNEEILKVALFAEMLNSKADDDVVAEFSIDGAKTWLPINMAQIVDQTTEVMKILNFNNIDNAALNTDEPVNEFYVRISLKATEDQSRKIFNNQISRLKMRASSMVNSFPLGDIGQDWNISVYALSNINLGADTVFNTSTTKNIQIEHGHVVDVFTDGAIVPLSLSDASIQQYLNLSSSTIVGAGDSTRVYHTYDLAYVERNDIIETFLSMDFDPFDMRLFSFSSPVEESRHVITNDRSLVDFSSVNKPAIPVLPIGLPAGKYKIIDGTKQYDVDLSSGFAESASQLVYAVSTETPVLISPIGEEIGIIDTFKIGDQVFCQLFDILQVKLPSISNISFSKEYPARELLPNEFSLIRNKLVFGNSFSGDVLLSLVYKSELQYKIERQLSGTRIITDRSRQVRARYKLSEFNFKNVAKLKHTRIVPQTVRFDTSEASINTFLTEVAFINGRDEFVVSDKYIQEGNRGLNTIPLHANFVDDGQLEFGACSELFVNRVYSEEELIYKGDYLIVTGPSGNYIKLPEGIYTSRAFDTNLKYNVSSSTISNSGLYSIDYINGIIYTSIPIDGETIVEYLYSSVFAQYEGLTVLPESDYSISNNQITLKIAGDSFRDFVLIADKTDDTGIRFNSSPLLKNFKINIIDTKSSI